MNNRLWGVVALFGGVVLMVGLWVVLSADTETADASGRAAAGAGERAENPRKQFKGGKKVTPVASETLAKASSPSDIAARQRMVAEMRARGGVGSRAPAAPGGSVFAFDEAGVRAAIAQRQADLDACWAAASANDAAMDPSFTAAIEVAPAEGHTYAVITAVSSDHGPGLDDCMTAVLMGTKFGADQAATLRYPMSFGE